MFKVLTLLKLMFSDDIGGRLKALASMKLKVETANRQSSNRVRTLHVDFEVPFNSQVGYVAQPRTRSVGYAGYGLLLSKGKPYKVAVTACMRKLLTVLNARMRDYFAENGTTENGIQTA